jgi:hypothetical protein
MQSDLLILAHDGSLYYAPAGSLRKVDDNAPGIAAAKQFLRANTGKAMGVHAALSNPPGIAAAQGMDGFMASAAKAHRDPKG